MNRREFHQTTLAGVFAATLPSHIPATAATPLPHPHPPDVVPAGASARLGTTRLWHQPEMGNEGLNDLAFSPDGRHLAALGYQDGCISLWEIPSGRLLRKWSADDADRCGSLRWSPAGDRLACGSNDGLRLWDPFTGELVHLLEPQANIHGVAFSPDGRTLAAAHAMFGGVVTLWDVATGRQLARLEGEPHPFDANGHERADEFECVAFSHDGRWLAAGSNWPLFHLDPPPELGQRLVARHVGVMGRGWGDRMYTVEPRGRVVVWEVSARRRFASLEGHEFPVEQVTFTPEGRLISAGTDGTMLAWDVLAGKSVGELCPSEGMTFRSGTAFTGDGRHAVVSRHKRLAVLDLQTGSEVHRFEVSDQWGGWYTVGIAPDARRLVTEHQGQMRLWDVSAGELSPTDRHTTWIRGIAFAGEDRVVTASTEAMLWDTQGRMLAKFEPSGWLTSEVVAVSPDGSRVACPMRRMAANNRDTVTQLVVWQWDGTARVFEDIEATRLYWSDAGTLIVGGKDLFALYLPSERRTTLARNLTQPVTALAAGPGGRVAAMFGGELAVHVWQGNSRQSRRLELTGLPAEPRRQYAPADRLCFSADGQSLAASVGFGQVCMGPVSGSTLPLVFAGPPDARDCTSTFAIGFRPDGRCLAAGTLPTGRNDYDEESGPFGAWVWDVGMGREVWSSQPDNGGWMSLALSPSGRTLALGSGNGTTVLWALPE